MNPMTLKQYLQIEFSIIVFTFFNAYVESMDQLVLELV